MITTIVMPVSREDYLKRIFAQLELLDCDAAQTNLLVIVDGHIDLFVKTRNMVEASKFNQKLCVNRHKGVPDVSSFRRRRKRIAMIHNEVKNYLGPCDYVFLLEDDTLFPTNALKKFLHDYATKPHAGIITGVQINRWGWNVPGIWKVDNPYAPQEIKSMLPTTPDEKDLIGPPVRNDLLVEIDASGLYCALTKREHYLSVEFEPFEDIAGPDMFYGFALRKQGYKNYVNWTINTSHLTKKGEIKVFNTPLQQIKLTRTPDGWRTEEVL